MLTGFSTDSLMILLGTGSVAGLVAWLVRGMIANRQTSQLIDEWESRKWNEYFEQVGEVPDWPESPPRSQHYKSKLKK